jgi:predicted neuraminidase
VLRRRALLLCIAARLAGAELQVERVFGPEVPTGLYKHPACLTELVNGDLYLVYYGGSGEYATDTSVYGSRKRKGETRWSAPRVIAHDPFRSTGNGVVWQAPDGRVWLFYVVRFGETWSNSRIQVKVSTDGAETWSDASMLSLNEGDMVRGHPIVLEDGDYLLPIYHETGNDPELVGPASASLFLRYDPRRNRWSRTNEVRSRIGNIQPAVVQIDRDYLIAYCRRGGDYGPRQDGWLVRTESRDGGRTWSPGQETRFPNPNSAVDFLRLRNGHLVLIYNDSMSERTPLTAALSVDNDRSYPWRRNIGEGRDSFAYPSAIQTGDGKIHVVYTSQQRTVIHHAIFDEAWIRGDTR